MAKKGKDYFGMPRLISIIFAIIPVTSWLFGAVTRFQEGKFLAGILRLLLGWTLSGFWTLFVFFSRVRFLDFLIFK